MGVTLRGSERGHRREIRHTDTIRIMTSEPLPPTTGADISLQDGLTVRPLHGPEELRSACRIYREIFGYTGEDQSLNPRLLQSLLNHGGSVIGAVGARGEILAMAYGWTAVDQTPEDSHVYHFSQAAVVAAELQGRGVGRAMKQAQAAVARHNGAERMRWTYDPLLSRNGHFNLDVLGARGRWFQKDAHGVPGTDRITVEWRLSGERPPLAASPVEELIIPTSKPAPGEQENLVDALRTRFHELFDAGYSAVSCRRSGEDEAVYTFQKEK